MSTTGALKTKIKHTCSSSETEASRYERERGGSGTPDYSYVQALLQCRHCMRDRSFSRMTPIDVL